MAIGNAKYGVETNPLYQAYTYGDNVFDGNGISNTSDPHSLLPATLQ